MRSAWAHTCGCKPRCKLVTASEVKRNCMKVTECGCQARSVNRESQDAVKAAWRFVQEGKRMVVDFDLSKFIDRVNHDILMVRLQRRISDVQMLG